MSDRIITAAELGEVTIAATRVEATAISLPFNGQPLVTIDLNDGSMTFGPDYTPDDAARLFWQAVQDAASPPAVRAFGPRLHARINEHLKAGEEAEQAIAGLRDEMARMCNCCATNRPHLRRMRELLGMPADDSLGGDAE